MMMIPPVFLRQLLHRHRLVGGRLLLHLVLEVLLADDLQVNLVLAGDVALLLEQDGSIPEGGQVSAGYCWLFPGCYCPS